MNFKTNGQKITDAVAGRLGIATHHGAQGRLQCPKFGKHWFRLLENRFYILMCHRLEKVAINIYSSNNSSLVQIRFAY